MDATINDVAKAANVSKATVSRFLNDRSRLKEETAQTIDRVIRELNYVPNATARNLALKQTDKLGILMSGIRSAFWNEVCGAIHDYISQHHQGMEVLSLNCDSLVLYYSNKSIRDKIQVLAEQRVAGIIFLLRELPVSDVDYVCELDIPFVGVQIDSDDERISSVDVDNREATQKITQYLLELGHRDIAYVSGPPDAVYAQQRFEGYREALAAKQLFRSSRVLQGDNTASDGYWRTKQMLSWDKLPTAILYASDSMAYGAMRAIGEAGLRIPEDISVAGFDGLREQIGIFDMLPPLTTVIQPMREIGENAAEMIMRKIADKERGKTKSYNVVLPTGFVDNGSCAKR